MLDLRVIEEIGCFFGDLDFEGLLEVFPEVFTVEEHVSAVQ
jgi:hypothetical protein